VSDGWKTMRVRVARFDAVTARAKAEGVSASAWIDRALDAALSGSDGRRDSEAPGASASDGSTGSASRRAPVAELRRALVEAEMRKAPLCAAILRAAIERVA